MKMLRSSPGVRTEEFRKKKKLDFIKINNKAFNF